MDDVVESKVGAVVSKQQTDAQKLHVGSSPMLVSVDGCIVVIECPAR